MSSESSQFPVHINLCQIKEVPDYDKPYKEGKERATKKVKDCPTLYISGIEGLDKIPEDGYMLIKIHRTSLTSTERNPGVKEDHYGLPIGPGDSGKEGKYHSVELEVHELCLPAGHGESDDEDGEDGFEHGLDKTAEKLGLKEKSKEADDDEDPDEEHNY